MTKDIEPYNDKGEKHGYWEEYLGGDLWFKRYFKNGKLIGYDEYHFRDNKRIKLRFHL